MNEVIVRKAIYRKNRFSLLRREKNRGFPFSGIVEKFFQNCRFLEKDYGIIQNPLAIIKDSITNFS